MRNLFAAALAVVVVLSMVLGAVYVVDEVSARRLPVIGYHHILKDEENTLFTENQAVISYDNFREQMKYLHDNGYQSIDSEGLIGFLNGRELPEKSVLITFDDGYQSNLTYAYPVLKEYGFHAMIFVMTGYIAGSDSPFDPDRLLMLSREGMAACSDVFEYFSHSHDMHKMIEKRPMLLVSSREEILADLDMSLNVEEIGVAGFAYPFGEYNAALVKCLKEKGVQFAITTRRDYAKKRTERYAIPRFVISRDTSFELFEEIITGRAKR